MAEYKVVITYHAVRVEGPYRRIYLENRRVPASYGVGQDTYHVVRISSRVVSAELIDNVVFNHALSLGFRGTDVVRLGGTSKRKRKVSDNQLGLFDINGDSDDA